MLGPSLNRLAFAHFQAALLFAFASSSSSSSLSSSFPSRASHFSSLFVSVLPSWPFFGLKSASAISSPVNGSMNRHVIDGSPIHIKAFRFRSNHSLAHFLVVATLFSIPKQASFSRHRHTAQTDRGIGKTSKLL